MDWQNYIVSNPEIMFGKPVVKDTRIPVALILEKLGNGISETELLKAYPRISIEAIRACLLYAAHNATFEKILAIG
jgi:uncharacterized protein (DUF433 family)